MLLKLLVVFSTLLYSSLSFSSDFIFKTEVNSKAEYKIDLKFSFDQTDLRDVLPGYLFSNELQTTIDQRTRRFHIESRNRRLYTELNKKNYFKVVVDATQYGKDVEVRYKCSLINFENEFSLSCNYDGLDDGIPFISVDPIVRSSYGLKCERDVDSQKIDCDFSMTGKTKDFNYVFIKRTADRLAISGMSVVVSSYYKAFLALSAGDVNGYQSYKSDSFFQSKIAHLRKNYFRYMKLDRLQKRSHIERGQK